MSARDDELGARLIAQAPRLRLFCAHLAGRALRKRVELDDLVQETFLRALADVERVPEPESGESALWRWLAAIARQTTIDASRRARAQKRDGRIEALVRSDWSRVGLHEGAVLAKTAGPATRAASNEENARLERAFLELEPEHRRVIGARQFEGLSAAETARRMARSEAAVHSLYRRALLAWEDATRRVSARKRDE